MEISDTLLFIAGIWLILVLLITGITLASGIKIKQRAVAPTQSTFDNIATEDEKPLFYYDSWFLEETTMGKHLPNIVLFCFTLSVLVRALFLALGIRDVILDDDNLIYLGLDCAGRAGDVICIILSLFVDYHSNRVLGTVSVGTGINWHELWSASDLWSRMSRRRPRGAQAVRVDVR